MIEDIKLKGKYIHGPIACKDKENTLHPQTCADQVLMQHNGSEAYNLLSWITSPYNPTSSDYEMKTSLIEWLHTYYPNGSSTTIPLASKTVRGGIKLGDFFTMDTGTEKLTIDLTSLSTTIWRDMPIASSSNLGGIRINLNQFNIDNIGVLSLKNATTTQLGGVKLGTMTTITTFEPIGAGIPFYSFPVGINGSNQIGVLIPTSYLDNTKKWLLDYYRSLTKINSAVDGQGNPTGINVNSQYNYILLGNTNILGSLDSPTMALVAGEGIEFNLSTDRILQSDGHGTFDTPVNEILIKSTGGNTSVPRATEDILGTIKLASNTYRESPIIAEEGTFYGVETDSNGKAGVLVPPTIVHDTSITNGAFVVGYPSGEGTIDFVQNKVFHASDYSSVDVWVNPNDSITIMNYNSGTQSINVYPNQINEDYPGCTTKIELKNLTARISNYTINDHSYVEIYILATSGIMGI